MKKVISRYTFNPTLRQVTFLDYQAIYLEGVLTIVNVNTGTLIYSFMDATKNGMSKDNVLTLTYNTSTMNGTDSLQIWYEDGTDLGDIMSDILDILKDIKSVLKDMAGESAKYKGGYRNVR